MPCLKTLSMSQAVLGEAPLFDAVYVQVLDKIFATSGVYVLKFNATTGALEQSVRISSPVNGNARLCYHTPTGLLYVTVWNEPSLGNTALVHPNKDIYPVSPAFMTVGARLDIITNTGFIITDDFNSNLEPFWGPNWIGSDQTTYLYLQWNQPGNYNVIRFDPTNFADRCTQAGDDCNIYVSEQISIGPTYIISADPNNEEFQYAPIGWNFAFEWSGCSIPTYFPIACEYCPLDTLTYAVDGNGNLFRINDPTTNDVTVFDLTATLAGADPCRLRWDGFSQFLYLPCSTTNSIIVWDVVSETGIVKTGFENPIDCVFTVTKAFAVQNSPAQSLKEIV